LRHLVAKLVIDVGEWEARKAATPSAGAAALRTGQKRSANPGAGAAGQRGGDSGSHRQRPQASGLISTDFMSGAGFGVWVPLSVTFIVEPGAAALGLSVLR